MKLQNPTPEAVDAWNNHGLHESLEHAWRHAKRMAPAVGPEAFDALMEVNRMFHAADAETKRLREQVSQPNSVVSENSVEVLTPETARKDKSGTEEDGLPTTDD